MIEQTWGGEKEESRATLGAGWTYWPLASCASLGELLSLSVPRFPCVKMKVKTVLPIRVIVSIKLVKACKALRTVLST